MSTYNYRLVHKISQTCRCGHSQSSHRQPVPADKARFPGDATWGKGACIMAKCADKPVGDYDGTTPCLEFQYGDVGQVELALPAVLDEKVMAKLLCATQVLHGTLREVRQLADGTIVCFPEKSSLWHSIILEPVQVAA